MMLNFKRNNHELWQVYDNIKYLFKSYKLLTYKLELIIDYCYVGTMAPSDIYTRT